MTPLTPATTAARHRRVTRVTPAVTADWDAYDTARRADITAQTEAAWTTR
ncbi:hypothetical protein [Streptosporangium roseum]